MKRITALTLAIVVVFVCCTANAESVYDKEFSIRNGIKYGISMDEIKNIEIQNGNMILNVDELGVEQFFGNDVEFVVATELAGNASSVIYWADDNHVLKEFQYWIPYVSYSTMEKSLVEKYGQPLTKNEKIPFQTRIMTLYENSSSASPKQTGYASWIVFYNDCCVVIEILGFDSVYVKNHVNINYYLVSHEEADAVLSAIEKKNNEIEQSSVNDL